MARELVWAGSTCAGVNRLLAVWPFNTELRVSKAQGNLDTNPLGIHTQKEVCLLRFRLVTMMATCMKALIWSFIFCFAIMTVWALLTVEVVHPLIQELYAKKVAFQDGNNSCGAWHGHL